MARTTPEEVFAEARAAVARGDWDGFFQCLDRDDLLRIAENGVTRFLAGGEATADTFSAVCAEHGVPDGLISGLRTRVQQVAESARASVTHARSDPATMLQQSHRHKLVVDEYQKAVKDTLTAVADLPSFAAALERAMRAVVGSGSVSSRLLVDDTLEAVSTAGSKAWGTRRTADGHPEDIGFVRRKGVWYIRLLAKKPGPRRD